MLPMKPLRNSLLLIVLSLLLSACASDTGPQTAEEFVKRYSAAWKKGDVDAILALQYDLRKFDVKKVPPAGAAYFAKFSPESERRHVEADLATKGFAYRAGISLEFISERGHDEHIHVQVGIEAARSEIVLMRDGGCLKVFPYPSWIN